MVPPPPQRRVQDAVAMEGLEEMMTKATPEMRALVKSRDFPELHGVDLQPMDVQVVLYDFHSVDGFAACYAARKALGDKAQYLGIDRSMTVEELQVSYDIDFGGKVVAMLGICWRHEEMHSFLMECPLVLVFENHATSAQELAELSYSHLVTVSDPGMGAGALAWNFFHPGDAVPPVLRYIEDDELGREVLDDAIAFADGFDSAHPFKPPAGLIRSNDEAFDDFSSLVEGNTSTIDKAIAEGNELATDLQEQGMQAYETCEVRTLRSFPAWRCAVVKLSSPLAGRIGEHALKEMVGGGDASVANRCLMALFEVKGCNVRVVLRSLQGGPHVDEIGSRYGGCGHPHHAFFSVPLDTWEGLWAPPELVLWNVESCGPSCLSLSQGDLVTIARRGERFRESPFDEWSWGYRQCRGKEEVQEGWIPTLAHTLFLATHDVPSDDGVQGLEEGDLLVAWAQCGDYIWGSKCDSSVATCLQGPKVWLPRAGLQVVHARSVRDMFAAACSNGVRGGA